MIFETEFGDETYRVSVIEKDGRFYATINDDAQSVVDIDQKDTTYSLLMDEHSFEIDMATDGNCNYNVYVNGKPYDLNVQNENRKLRKLMRGDKFAGQEVMVSKMPGKIIKVLKQGGDEVKIGESVLVMEAMKMENEMLAPIDGVIKELSVSEGDVIEAGTTLAVFE
jgi:biotin carboxyl carrier protein